VAADHAGYVSHLRDDLGRQRDAGARVTPDPFSEPQRRLNLGIRSSSLASPGVATTDTSTSTRALIPASRTRLSHAAKREQLETGLVLEQRALAPDNEQAR
jgi:hypothetical protein